MIRLADQPLYVSWYTSATDGHLHAVTDEEIAQARAAGTDPDTVCGQIMLPTPLTAPVGVACERCALFVNAQQTLPDFDLSDGDHLSWWTWVRHHFPASWPFRSGPRPAVGGQEPNRGGPAVPRPGGAATHDPQPSQPL